MREQGFGSNDAIGIGLWPRPGKRLAAYSRARALRGVASSRLVSEAVTP